MQGYLQRFDQLYKGKTSIEIEFVTEEPFSAKYSRNNQSGQVCYCMFGSDEANQKTQDGWQRIKCLGQECQYRQKKEIGPPDCRKVGWLKFLIPKIATDRIWLMKITSSQAIDTLDEYFSLQKEQGNSVKGKYILFLKQVENSKKGKTFNNYIVDIMKKEDFISNKQDPAEVKNTVKQFTTNEQTVNNNVDNIEESAKETVKPKKTGTKKTTTIKPTKVKSKKVKTVAISKKPDLDKCYYFTKYHTETFTKDGKPKDYFIGEFYNMKDEPVNLVVKPDLIDAILECGIGSIFETEIQEFKDKKILIDIKFVQNNEKNTEQNKIAA